MKRKLAFGTRPKKTGARKKYRIKTHKKRLIAAGHDEASLRKLNPQQLRQLLKRAARKKGPKTAKPAAKAGAKAKPRAKKAK